MKFFSMDLRPDGDQLIYLVVLLILGGYVGYKLSPIKSCNAFGFCEAADPLLYTLAGILFVGILTFVLITIYNNFD